mgnify:CR=1 FL=1
MNKYKKLAFNTMIFAIGSFGSKILVILLTRLYTGNINPADSGTRKMLEIMSWLTNDVDWITGECHETIKRLAWHLPVPF